jgi:hypothetical protein
MLHVFYVFSNITARVTMRTIEHLSLDPKNVLILVDRSMKTSSIPLQVRIENLAFQPFPRSWPNLIPNWRAIRANSRRLIHLTGGQHFTTYVPSSSDATCQQIIHHPYCLKYHLIEEGLASYCPPGAKPVRMSMETWHWRLRARFKGLLSGAGRVFQTFTDFPFWKRKYAGCFGSTDQTFPKFPEPRIILQKPLYSPVATPITHLVIFDDFSWFTQSLKQAYLMAVRWVIESEANEGDHWAVKLHPQCARWAPLIEEAETIFREALPQRTSFSFLSPDECAEDIGISAGVTTYGYLSSCLFYINKSGGRVVSFKNILDARDPAFIDLWQRIYPPVLETIVSGFQTRG